MASFEYGGLVLQEAVIATAAGTTTLVNTSKQNEIFTGSTTQTIVLPDATTMSVGQFFNIFNQSSGALTLHFNGGAAFTDASGKSYSNVPANSSLTIALQTNGTSAGTWAVTSAASSGVNTWITSTPYVAGNLVIYSQMIWIATGSFTSSGSMETDIKNGNFRMLNEPPVGENLFSVSSNFEDADVGGWTGTGIATLTNGLPTTVGSGAAPFSSSNGGRALGANTTAPAVTSTGAINGTYSASSLGTLVLGNSLNLATSGAGTIGDGYISQVFAIAPKYQGQMLTFKGSYKVASGTPNMSGTSSNTYAVAVYDVANNAWFGVAGQFNFIQSTGVGTFSGTFQTAINSTGFQVFIYSPVAPTGASSLLLDDFYVGPQITASGAAMTDWTPFTPTGTWTTNTTYHGMYKRIGDTAIIRYEWELTGAPNAATNLTINMPAGMVIDSTKLPANQTQYSVSTGTFLRAGILVLTIQANTVGTTTSFGIFSLGTATTNIGQGGQVSTASPFTWGNGDYGQIEVIVPIVGWSSNTSMSADTDTRVIAASLQKSTGQSLTQNSDTQVTFDVVVNDSNSGWSTANNQYTAYVSGWYEFSGSLFENGASSAGSGAIILYKNGSAFERNSTPRWSTLASVGLDYEFLVYANAGDIFQIRCNLSTASSNIGGNNSAPGITSLNIKRLSGPATVQATESVNGRYYSCSTTVTGTASVMVYTTKGWDSHGAYNNSTGIWTCPVSGKYQFNTSINISGTYTLNILTDLAIYQYGSSSQISETAIRAGGAESYIQPTVSDIFYCQAGDLIRVWAYSGATSPSITASNNINFLSWSRVGN